MFIFLTKGENKEYVKTSNGSAITRRNPYTNHTNCQLVNIPFVRCSVIFFLIFYLGFFQVLFKM